MSCDQKMYFGKSEKVFTPKEMTRIMKKDAENPKDNFYNTKKYFLTYYAKSLDDVYYKYAPSEEEGDNDGRIENMTRKQMDAVFNNFQETVNYMYENENTGKREEATFNLKTWFYKKHDDIFQINSDPIAPRFYESAKTGQQYINLSKGFLHKNRKKYESFSKKIKENVQKVINHIKNVWNSGNNEASEYCLSWLAHSLTGHKMKTALFLKSGEGTGKSVIVDFIIKHVIGNDLGLSTSRPQQIMKFNAQLLGKIMLCLEELPASSKSEWFSISDFLKDLITGSNVDIERKYQDCIQTRNNISLMILTNNDNTIKFGNTARRYFFADISHDKTGDDEYFNDLVEALTRETGEAFHMWLWERYETNKDFEEERIPMTESKLEMKNRNLSPILKYVKSEYVAQRKGLLSEKDKHKMIKLNDMKEAINFDFQTKYSTHQFHIAVKSEISICKTMNYGKNKDLYILPVEFEELYDYYVKKGFWCDTLDQFTCEDVKPLSKDDMKDISVTKELVLEKEKNKKLQEEIEQLKARLAELESKTVRNKTEEPTKIHKIAEKKEPKELEIHFDSENFDDFNIYADADDDDDTVVVEKPKPKKKTSVQKIREKKVSKKAAIPRVRDIVDETVEEFENVDDLF